jgi:hypothetical protein
VGKLNPNDWSVDESVGPPRWTAMRDKEFEWFLKGVFEQLGYQVEVTKASGDQGVDLIVFGGGRRIAIQVKGYANAVGNSAVQEVYAGMNYGKCQECAVITNSRFTKLAKHLAASLNCKLIDRRSMDDLMAGEHPWARKLRTADDYFRIKHPIELRASAGNQMQASGGTGSSGPLQVPAVPHPSWTSPEQNPHSELDRMPNWGQAGTFLLVVFVLALVGLGIVRLWTSGPRLAGVLDAALAIVVCGTYGACVDKWSPETAMVLAWLVAVAGLAFRCFLLS